MPSYLISCENATCTVPEANRELFRGYEETVTSLEGWEPGALNLAQGFAIRFCTPLVHGEVTRLLINIENEGDARWSAISSKLPEATRVKLFERHQLTYRNTLQQRITEDLRRHELVIHLMIHTDSILDGSVLLETSPGASTAAKLAEAWKRAMTTSDLVVRHDASAIPVALAAGLAQSYPMERYAQIHLKVSQTFFLENRPWRWETLKKHLLDSLSRSLSTPDLSGQELTSIALR